MKIEILDFKKEMRDGSKVHGHLKVIAKDSFTCWLTVLLNNKGGFFFVTPSVRIDEKFVPSFEFASMNFSKECYDKLKNEFESKWNR